MLQFQPNALPLVLALSSALFVSGVSSAPIVQPGAPGETGQVLSAEEAVRITDTSYSPADTHFMQMMIPHHAQALEMAQLVEVRTNRPELVDIAGRIKSSQSDEIDFMQSWLTDRGEAPMAHAHHMLSTHHKMDMGMASDAQMTELAGAESVNFDRQFLSLMIRHHEGAVDMVKDLLDQPGSAYDPLLYDFVGDIKNDQMVEIERMNALLVTLSDDPRANLKAGLTDAGIAIKNMTLVASLSKPAGFVDPNNPGELAKASPEKEESDEAQDKKKSPIEGGKRKRSPLLSFSNTDMAFAGNTLVAGSYHGFNVYDLQDNGTGADRAGFIGNLSTISAQGQCIRRKRVRAGGNITRC